MMMQRVPKSKRRWMQFSLRTGLIVVTTLCVALSMWVVPIERQRRAVAAIEKLGGHVGYMHELLDRGILVKPTASETFPVTYLRRWLPLPPDYFDEIEMVNLNNTQVTDAGLAQLQRLTGLHSLNLSDTEVTDAGMAHLQGLSGLEGLSLINTKVTDVGLAHLQGLTGLQVLRLDKTQITDAGLAHLQKLTRLQGLTLTNTQITDAGLAQLRRALPNCRIEAP